ncbi:hypothetical protein [Neomegalonema sp.]|uniref:hypothetical protein n=1 Tax=Neomegalonema sp. TaxID=2039713 RepID=UPI002631EB11|nr:hypothetical protein [Neomegalonema sp.]MDD2869662.1 hypothetical protein [Neomegalonema sp.]
MSGRKVVMNGAGIIIEQPIIDPPVSENISIDFDNPERSIYQLSTGDYIDLSLIASIGAANEFPETGLFQIPVILLHSYEPLYISGPKEVFQELVDAWKRYKGE